MHIGMVHLDHDHFPPDIRVEKEIDALVSAGMKVSVLCPRSSDNEPEQEELASGATVYRRRRIKHSALRYLTLPIERWLLLQNASWKPAIRDFLAVAQPDALHVHDLTHLPTVLSVVKGRNIPVVGDYHETMSAAVAVYAIGRSTGPRRLFYRLRHHPRVYRWHEIHAARQCAKIIVVVEEGMEPFTKVGIPQDKIVVVANREDEKTMMFPLPRIDNGLREEYQNKWLALYFGGIGVHRGIDTAIRGVAAIVREIPNYLLLIVGAQGMSREKLENMAEQYGLGRYVKVLGWEPFDRGLQFIQLANACLVPHNDFKHTQMAAPHKLFQYMACGKPVIVSDCRPLKRLVEHAQAGVVFRANDPEDFARATISLAQNPELATACGANGKKAALGEYSWKHDAARLVEMYRQIEMSLSASK